MTKINFTIFPSLYDTEVTEKNSYASTWEKLSQRLQKPTVSPDKNSAKMFNGASFKVGGKRCGEDLLMQHLLVLDIDEGYHPKMFLEDFGKYEMVLYASYNHNWNKAEGRIDTDVMKFRAVLPLKTPVTGEHYRKMKTLLIRHFDGVDPASFVPSQAFFLPSHHPERAEQFFAIHNEGEWFDFNAFSTELFIQETLQKARQNNHKVKQANFQQTTPIEEAKVLLKGMSADCGYDVWWKVGACLKTLYGDAGFDVWHTWSSSGVSFDGNERKLRTKWNTFRDTSNYTYGYLVNRSREFPTKRF